MDSPAHHTESLERCIRLRHSIRYYKPDPVPKETLQSCLALAQMAPSNSNIQNWRLTLASGAARDRIVSALEAEAKLHPPEGIPDLPSEFKHYRSEMGHLLYGAHGYSIAREDREGAAAARMRNYRFFDAPVVGIIHTAKNLSAVDTMSVGMYVQTLMLALTEQGLGACLQVSVTGYAKVLTKEFGLGEGQVLLCGIAVGWPAEGNKVNELVMARDDPGDAVSFLVD